jgi:hypothetical protein
VGVELRHREVEAGVFRSQLSETDD